MATKNPVLLEHALAHVPEVRVDANILRSRFTPDCRTTRCEAECCSGGVWIDLAERDRILANADRVRREMQPGQEQDPARWFEDDEDEDEDFPSGRAVSTRVHDDKCVFLDANRRCVLHKASSQELPLKPFYCRAYPITLENRELRLDDGCDSRCCLPDPQGVAPVIEVCAGELGYVLGERGLAELRRIAEEAVRPAARRAER